MESAEEVAASHVRSLAPPKPTSVPPQSAVHAVSSHAVTPAFAASQPPLQQARAEAPAAVNTAPQEAAAQPAMVDDPAQAQVQQRVEGQHNSNNIQMQSPNVASNRAIENLPSVIVDADAAGGDMADPVQSNFFAAGEAHESDADEIFELPLNRPPRRVLSKLLAMVAASALLTGLFVAYYDDSSSEKQTVSEALATDTSSAINPASSTEAPAQTQLGQPTEPQVEYNSNSEPPKLEAVDGEEAAPATEDEEQTTAAEEAPLQPQQQAEQAAVDELLATAAKKQKKGKRKEALAAYEAALALAPGSSQILGKIALVHLESNQNKPAQEYAEKAVAADANNAEGWIVLGAARQIRGDAKAAREAYQRCAELPDARYATECRRMSR